MRSLFCSVPGSGMALAPRCFGYNKQALHSTCDLSRRGRGREPWPGTPSLI